MAAWRQGERSGRILFAQRAIGGRWAARVMSGARKPVDDPQMAVDGRGRAVVAWSRFGAAPRGVYVARQTASGRWTAPRVVSDPLRNVGWMDVAADRSGGITVAWTGVNGSVRAADRPAGRRWQEAVAVAPRGSVFQGLEVSMNGAGDALLVWTSLRGVHHPAQFAARSRSGPWSSPRLLSPRRGDTFGPVAGVLRDGSAVAVWLHAPDERGSRVQARTVTVR